MPHPDVRVFVTSCVAFPVYRDWLKRARDDVLAALRESHAGPLFPLGDRSGDDKGPGHELQELGAELVVDAEPGVERRTVVPLPPDVAFEGREGISTLQGRTDGRDEGVHAAFLGQRAHGSQDFRAQAASLVGCCYERGEGRERVRGTPVAAGAYATIHKFGHSGWQVIGGAVPDEGYSVPDRDQGARGLAEEDLVLHELIEERSPVGYVAVQQKGGPALPAQPVNRLLEIRPLRQSLYLERQSLVPQDGVRVLVGLSEQRECAVASRCMSVPPFIYAQTGARRGGRGPARAPGRRCSSRRGRGAGEVGLGAPGPTSSSAR